MMAEVVGQIVCANCWAKCEQLDEFGVADIYGRFVLFSSLCVSLGMRLGKRFRLVCIQLQKFALICTDGRLLGCRLI